MKKSILALLFLCLFMADATAQLTVGAEILIRDHQQGLRRHSIGLVMNPTARINGVHMLDTLIALDLPVKALFAPEHGFRGEAGAGETIEDGIDQATGLPVHSLYGQTRKPTAEMLEGIDLLLFDMQDVGARFYTYNVTLGRLLEAAGKHDVDVWVLDRPNPAGGNYISGWLMQDSLQSFVGAWPIPIAHGMTLGELGKMMIGENWLDVEHKPTLRVIPMEGWDRSMRWNESSLDWFPPSPNLPEFEHALVYLGTCLIEGTNLSEGRGTPDPFLTIGAPWLKLPMYKLDQLENRYRITIDTISFNPVSIPGKSRHPKFQDQRCQGISLRVKPGQMDQFRPVEFGVELLHILKQANPKLEIEPYMYNLTGSSKIDSLLDSKKPIKSFGWEEEIKEFINRREPYLLYE